MHAPGIRRAGEGVELHGTAAAGQALRGAGHASGRRAPAWRGTAALPPVALASFGDRPAEARAERLLAPLAKRAARLPGRPRRGSSRAAAASRCTRPRGVRPAASPTCRDRTPPPCPCRRSPRPSGFQPAAGSGSARASRRCRSCCRPGARRRPAVGSVAGASTRPASFTESVELALARASARPSASSFLPATSARERRRRRGQREAREEVPGDAPRRRSRRSRRGCGPRRPVSWQVESTLQRPTSTPRRSSYRCRSGSRRRPPPPRGRRRRIRSLARHCAKLSAAEGKEPPPS